MNRSFEQDLETRLADEANAYEPRPDIDSVKADTILSAPTVRHPGRYGPLMPRLAVVAAMALVISGAGALLLRQSEDGVGTVAADESANTAEPSDEPSLVDPVIRHQHEPADNDGQDAEIKGEVRLDGQCVFVGNHLTIWPHGTSWDADSKAVIFPNGDTAPLGSFVSGGGGYTSLDQLGESIGVEATEQAEGCVTTDAEVAVLNNHPEAVEPDPNPTPPPHSGESTACGIPYSKAAEVEEFPNFWFADLDSSVGIFESGEFGGFETETELVDSVVYRTTTPQDEELKRIESTNVTFRWPADTETVAQSGYELELEETNARVLVWAKDRSRYEYVIAEIYTEFLNQQFVEAGGCTTLSVTFEHEGQSYGPVVIEY